MTCTQCHIPGYVETASGLCQSCDRAAREQEGKGDGDVERLTKERDGIAAVLVAEQGCRRDALEKLSEAEAEVERLRAVLRSIANDGCYMPDEMTCPERTDDREGWCWSCIAHAAIVDEVKPGGGE